MVTQSPRAPQALAPPGSPSGAGAAHAPGAPAVAIGVGIDTARYGHYAAFLNDQLQQAAPELAVAESAAGAWARPRRSRRPPTSWPASSTT